MQDVPSSILMIQTIQNQLQFHFSVEFQVTQRITFYVTSISFNIVVTSVLFSLHNCPYFVKTNLQQSLSCSLPVSSLVPKSNPHVFGWITVHRSERGAPEFLTGMNWLYWRLRYAHTNICCDDTQCRWWTETTKRWSESKWRRSR